MTWTTDGSPELSVVGDTVTCTGVEGDGAFNALWSDGSSGVSSGEHYWKFHFPQLEESGAFVGLTNREKFARGYGIKCVSYGGNLSDGSGALVLEYGPRFSTGDTVGMLVEYRGDDLLVYYDYNGRNLGLAFHVPAKELLNAFPAVHFSADGSATCTKAQPPLGIRTRSPELFQSIYGPWRMISMTHNGCPVSTPVQPTILVSQDENADCLGVSGTVVNHLYWPLTKNADGNWLGSSPQTTLMLGPPDEMKLEYVFAELFAGICTISVAEDGHLLCTASGDNMRATFERYDPSPQPYKGNPFEH